MSGAFEIAGIGLSAQQRALDTIADNIANVNTRSFKRSEVRFSEVMARAVEGAAPASSGAPAQTVAGISASPVLLLDEQGQLESTGRALDLAIDGAGFIELMGPGGQTYLWRGGTLEIGSDGFLAAGNGMALKDLVSVPLDSSALSIDRDGRVFSSSVSEPDGVEIGQISLVRPTSMSGLERFDGGLYRADSQTDMVVAAAGEDGNGFLVQGSVERSNVDLNNEMVQLMIVQRAYAANSKVVQAADEVAGIVNGLRR